MGKYLKKVRDQHVGSFAIRVKGSQVAGKSAYYLERSLKVVGNKATDYSHTEAPVGSK